MPDAPETAVTGTVAAPQPTATVNSTTPETGTTPPAPAALLAPVQPEAPSTDAATADAALLAELAAAKADADKWRDLSRKNETKAKANADAAKELEAMRLANMSEQERVTAEAFASGKAEAMRELGATLVRAELRAVSAGRIDAERLDALIAHLDLSRYLDEKGQVKSDDLASLLDTIAPKPVDPPAAQEGTQGQSTPPATAVQQASAAVLPPMDLAARGDVGQGPGRSAGPPALNSDALNETVLRMVGATPARR